MSPLERIKELECSLPVNELDFKGLPTWAILKPYLFDAIRKTDYQHNVSTSHLFTKVLWGIKQLALFLLEVPRLAKRNPIVISTNSLENRPIAGKLCNKIFFQFIHTFQDRVTLLEKPVTHVALSDHSERIGLLPVVLACKILAKILARLLPRHTLETIDSKIPTSALLWEFSLYRGFWRFFFAYHRPKIVLLSNYYNTFNLSLISVSREKDVPIIEFQHGIIHHLHPAYSFPRLKNKKLFPDILAYYLLEKNPDPHFYISHKNTLNVGHPYLQMTSSKDDSTPPSWWDSTTPTVLVTLQHGYIEDVVSFLREGVGQDKSFKFILCPRTADENVPSDLPASFYIERKLNFYECLKFTHVHCTYVSTCALEAAMLGIPTVAIELNDLTRKYLSPFITEDKISYVSSPTQVLPACHTLISARTNQAYEVFDVSEIEELIRQRLV